MGVGRSFIYAMPEGQQLSESWKGRKVWRIQRWLGSWLCHFYSYGHHQPHLWQGWERKTREWSSGRKPRNVLYWNHVYYLTYFTAGFENTRKMQDHVTGKSHNKIGIQMILLYFFSPFMSMSFILVYLRFLLLSLFWLTIYST